MVEYTKIHPRLVFERCNYAVHELAILWNNKKSVVDYYQDTDLYIYDLTQYQIYLEHKNLVNEMIKQIQELGLKKVLEFGGGIGEFSIKAFEAGLHPTYHDLPGPTRKYALWRFIKYNAAVHIDNDNPLDEEWDLINVMDVLEHLENPEKVIKKLVEKTNYIFCNPEEVQYNHIYPQHISKFNLEPYFEKVSGYLWKKIETDIES